MVFGATCSILLGFQRSRKIQGKHITGSWAVNKMHYIGAKEQLPMILVFGLPAQEVAELQPGASGSELGGASGFWKRL